jgi:hypothetical protein
MGDIAATQYIVERIESDLLSGNRNMAWRAAAPLARGTPLFTPRMPDASRPLVLHEADADEIRRNARGDMIRILDREQNVVWWREYQLRERGVRKYSEILDDVMKLEVEPFRRKYGIIPERPSGVEAPGQGPSHAVAPGSAQDPLGPWGDKVRHAEGGADWKPSTEAGGSREGDIGWGDPGQR